MFAEQANLSKVLYKYNTLPLVKLLDFYAAVIIFQSTECEIFLSLLVKFMDVEKPMWQRCIALEVVHKLCSDAHLVRLVNRYRLIDWEPPLAILFFFSPSAMFGV